MTALAAITAAFAAGYITGLYCTRQKPPLPSLTARQRRWR